MTAFLVPPEDLGVAAVIPEGSDLLRQNALKSGGAADGLFQKLIAAPGIQEPVHDAGVGGFQPVDIIARDVQQLPAGTVLPVKVPEAGLERIVEGELLLQFRVLPAKPFLCLMMVRNDPGAVSQMTVQKIRDLPQTLCPGPGGSDHQVDPRREESCSELLIGHGSAVPVFQFLQDTAAQHGRDVYLRIPQCRYDGGGFGPQSRGGSAVC